MVCGIYVVEEFNYIHLSIDARCHLTSQNLKGLEIR